MAISSPTSAIGEYGRTRMIRTLTHKYIHRYPDGPHEFYVLKHDPDERANLIYDPRFSAQVIQMMGDMVDWFTTYSLRERDGSLLPITGRGSWIGQTHHSTVTSPLPSNGRKAGGSLPPIIKEDGAGYCVCVSTHDKDQYTAAIIGLGFIGAADQVSGDRLGQQVTNLDGTHVEAFERNPRISIIGGSSRDAGRRERFEERSGVKTYADWHQLISESAPDIVSVATYTPTHCEITLACAEAEIPVIYCEKPIASSLHDAERMIHACEDSGSLLVVNHNRRFCRTFREIRMRLKNGLLGELTSVHMQWPSGRLGNVGTHMFDAIMMVLDRPIVGVSGTLDLAGKPDCRGDEFSDPGGWGLIRFDDGLIATVSAPDYSNQPLSAVIRGSEGSLLIQGRNAYYSESGESEWELILETEESSMDVAVREIVAWLDSGSPFPYEPSAAMEALEVITAFHVSHSQNGCWVDLPLHASDRKRIIKSG